VASNFVSQDLLIITLIQCHVKKVSYLLGEMLNRFPIPQNLVSWIYQITKLNCCKQFIYTGIVTLTFPGGTEIGLKISKFYCFKQGKRPSQNI